MKKLMMVMVAMVLAVPAFAMDVYAVKMTVKTPCVKYLNGTYYKDSGKRLYNGFLGIDYLPDGSVTGACPMVVYYRLNGKYIANVSTVNFNSLNLQGKNLSKVECNADCCMKECTLNLCGDGSCVKTEPADGCSSFQQVRRINTFTCDITGLLTEPLTSPCGESLSCQFNCCEKIPTAVPESNCMSGTAMFRFNKAVTEKCNRCGFWFTVLGRLPAGCVVE